MPDPNFPALPSEYGFDHVARTFRKTFFTLGGVQQSSVPKAQHSAQHFS
jgi:hypothetical protein